MLLTYTSEVTGELIFTVPPTTRDVLDWAVWIRCIADPVQQAWAALQWASQWIPAHDAESLGAATKNDLNALIALCNHIAASAGIPDDLLSQMAQLLDRQNEVPEDWKPKLACNCVRCRRGVEVGQPCEYDQYDPRTLAALSQVTGDHTAPLYWTQVQSVQTQAEARRLRYEREKREADDRHKTRLSEAFKRVNS